MIRDAVSAVSLLRSRLSARRDPVAFAQKLGVRVGRECRLIAPTTATFGGEPYLVWLGDRVVISAEVRMITHDGGVVVGRASYPQIDVAGPVIVRSGAFVGLRAILLPGCIVGRGSVIAAGAVVTGEIPAGTVAGGVPAQPICSVQEFLARAQQKSFPTYGLSVAEKRRVFLSRFGASLREEEMRDRRDNGFDI